MITTDILEEISVVDFLKEAKENFRTRQNVSIIYKNINERTLEVGHMVGVHTITINVSNFTKDIYVVIRRNVEVVFVIIDTEVLFNVVVY